jgi:hypothetical protein
MIVKDAVKNTKAKSSASGTANSSAKAAQTVKVNPNAILGSSNLAPRDDYGTTSASGVYSPPGSGGYGGGGGGGSFAPSAAVGGDDDSWLAGDSSYQAQLAALLKAAQDSDADFGAQKSKYDVDYNDSLKNLGWNQPVVDDPSTPDVDESKPGAWNFQDLNTAAGRGYNNTQNDFASRGLLQSSLFGTALDNFTRLLNDQLTGINTGKQNFLDDLTRQQSAAQSENTLNQQQARADALARRAAGVSLV